LKSLSDNEAKNGTCEVNFLIAAIYNNFAIARLNPNAGDRVLPLPSTTSLRSARDCAVFVSVSDMF